MLIAIGGCGGGTGMRCTVRRGTGGDGVSVRGSGSRGAAGADAAAAGRGAAGADAAAAFDGACTASIPTQPIIGASEPHSSKKASRSSVRPARLTEVARIAASIRFDNFPVNPTWSSSGAT